MKTINHVEYVSVIHSIDLSITTDILNVP